MTEDPSALPPGVTMTLAAIAATGAVARPSGETLAVQKQRIFDGIVQQLSDTTLATQGNWELAWLGLSPDNANMAYIAKGKGSGSNQFAVVVRGTVGNEIDTLEDLDVGTVVPFTVGGSAPVSVSKGAMTAFTQIVAMTDQSSAAGPGLVQALAALLGPAPGATVYVVGHSLGGCIATMLALYLQAQTWNDSPQFAVSTFAAPTAGLKDFADLFNSVKWAVYQGYANKYDIVPLAWASLGTATGWYPAPGPAAPLAVKDVLIPGIKGLSGPNTYVQPSTTVPLLNPDYKAYNPKVIKSSTQDFLAQVAFQHANPTYLKLLNSPVPAPAPVVDGISPRAGAAGMQITITGSGFDTQSMVDFGTVPCVPPNVVSDTQITAIVPDGLGVVDVRVTNNLGTSPAVPFGQFAYGGPEPVVVTGIVPDSGTLGTAVTINGAGFGGGGTPVVYFGDRPATATPVSPTQIRTTVPIPDPKQPKTVDVRVRVNGYLSPAVPADEFTHTG
ncbi:IPT/TIG domain-containing protein [Kitasatospora sp. NPDC047058]|uniref:IPT/TIG domain-containing protein n=1 Tax=Kitasatospora sp. NPDC047058 TaxID=3155620 RepID=UPI0033D754F7